RLLAATRLLKPPALGDLLYSVPETRRVVRGGATRRCGGPAGTRLLRGPLQDVRLQLQQRSIAAVNSESAESGGHRWRQFSSTEVTAAVGNRRRHCLGAVIGGGIRRVCGRVRCACGGRRRRRGRGR